VAGKNTANKELVNSAGAMGVGVLLSRITGLLREQVFAYFFGAGSATDAFQIAFRIPNLLRDLFAEGAMSTSLVATFIKAKQQKGEREAWRLSGLVFRILFFGTVILSVIGLFLAPYLVEAFASSYHEVPGKFELTVQLTQVLYWFFPFVALAAAFMGILNACGVYFLPAFASALFNITSVVSGVIFVLILPRWGVHPIMGMAMGVVLGGVVQALCQVGAIKKQGYYFPKKIETDPVWFKNKSLHEMLWLMIPSTIGLAALQVNILVNSVLATGLGDGAVSWIQYSFRLVQFPAGIFGVSLAVASMTQFSRKWSGGHFQEASEDLKGAIRQVIAINVPASVMMFVLGKPIIQLLFEYGRFNSEDTHMTALAFSISVLGLLSFSLIKILVRPFYVMQDTRIPVISSLLGVAVNVIINFTLVKKVGFVGLPIGTVLSTIINAGYLVWAYKKKVKTYSVLFDLSRIVRFFFLILFVSVVMGGVCYIVFYKIIINWSWIEFASLNLGIFGIVLERGLHLTISFAVGTSVLVFLSNLFKIEEVILPINTVIGKLKRTVIK